MNGLEELARIGRAAVEVDRHRERQAAAFKARNRCRCWRESNVSGGGRSFVEPCWKQTRTRSVGSPPEPVVELLPFWALCPGCQRRAVRHRAVLAAVRQLGGARRRVIMLARRYRRESVDGRGRHA